MKLIEKIFLNTNYSSGRVKGNLLPSQKNVKKWVDRHLNPLPGWRTC